MKGRVLVVSPERCVGCGICEYICSYKKEGIFNPLKSRIRAVRIGLVNMAISCQKCEDPPCVEACMHASSQISAQNTVSVGS